MDILELIFGVTSGIGAIWAINHIDVPFRALNTHFLKSTPDFSTIYGSGSWVVITGGSDGIGWGFAEAFAKRKFNIVMIARN